jgi:hypothetical protein
MPGSNRQAQQPTTNYRQLNTPARVGGTAQQLTSEAWSECCQLPRQSVLTEDLIQLEWTQVDLED